MRASPLHNLEQTASVAALFWGVCLGLVTLEATVGANPVSSLLFFLSVPALVTGLFWANRSLLRSHPRLVALTACSRRGTRRTTRRRSRSRRVAR
jgi:hypothetical protein